MSSSPLVICTLHVEFIYENDYTTGLQVPEAYLPIPETSQTSGGLLMSQPVPCTQRAFTTSHVLTSFVGRKSTSTLSLTTCNSPPHPQKLLPIPPTTIPTILELNCSVLEQIARRIFTVEIETTKNVSTLKDIIKQKQESKLDHVPADTFKP